MEITERLRNTPTGLIVFVGDMKIIVEKYRPYYNLRPDHESVVFAKTSNV